MELLVVTGVLVVLAGIIIAAVSHSRRAAATIKVKSDLQAVATALEAYKADFRKYPLRTVASDPWILARALVGPADDDGQAGSGFRTIAGGKIWPSYLPADRFRVQEVTENPAGSGMWVKSPGSKQWALLDTYGNPIQYYPKRTTFCKDGKTLAVQLIGPYLSTGDYIYEVTDGNMPVDSMRLILGDNSLNNRIDAANEQLRFSGDYILASPGADGRWMKKSDDPANVDDALNFDL